MINRYPSQAAGDVILLNGAGKRSKENRLGQTIYTFRRAKYSHVAFCVGVGGFIHSEPEAGVDFIFIDDLLKKYDGKWMAIRNRDIFKNGIDDYWSIYSRCLYYLEQEYNKKLKGIISKKTPHDSCFCSQLVACVFR